MLKIVVLLAVFFSVSSFAPSPTFAVRSPRMSTPLFEAPDGKERGVSIDQDGKSNVWAIEPKMEVESKSGGEKAKGAVIALVGIGLAVGAAGTILGNLPDPNQF